MNEKDVVRLTAAQMLEFVFGRKMGAAGIMHQRLVALRSILGIIVALEFQLADHQFLDFESPDSGSADY